jgi:uncharacterized protein YjbI with pentapeptide repeats
MIRAVSKPPSSPYPPDRSDDDVEAAAGPDDLADAVVEDADWANRRSPGLALLRVEARRCRFTGAELGESTLTDVALDECRLDLVGLRFAKLRRVVFRDCRMSGCDLYGATLEDVLFERCELREATFSSARVERVELRGCDLAGVLGADALRGARMPWNDVLGNAPLFATALGIEIVD